MQRIDISILGRHHQFIIDDDFCKLCGVDDLNINSVSLFMCSYLALLSDSPLNCNSSSKPLRVYNDFIKSFKTHGFKNRILQLSRLSHKLVSQHTLMGQSTGIGDWIPEFKDTPVFFEYSRYFKTGDSSLLKYLYTFLNFGKKLEYTDDAFNDTAFRSWLDIENRLANQSYDEVDVFSLQRILSIALPTFTISSFFPRFGNGSVAERGVRGRIRKIKHFSYDYKIDRFLFHGHIGKYGYGEESGLRFDKVVPNPLVWSQDRRVSSRTARLMFVPKDLKTARSICMEPNVLQFFQQGVLRSSIRLLKHSYFNRFIRLDSQERNKSLARSGSYTSLIDTIDLSSASDTLSYSLVKKVFPPSWQIPMRVTRSDSCFLPNGVKHRLVKFAPMGSALCFPTQCILFTSVVVYAACLYTYNRSVPTQLFETWLDRDRVISIIKSFTDDISYNKIGFQPCAVYGDDICVDSRLTHIVMSILDRLGFLVNRDKSFVGSQSFRESCGGFYLDDADVTPLLYRVKGVRQKLSAEHLASAISLINRAYDLGYKNLYRFMVRSILYWNSSLRSPISDKNAILFIEPSSDSFGVKHPKPSNQHLLRRNNTDYQRIEAKCIAISYKYIHRDDSVHTDEYDYMRWMGSHTPGSFIDEFSSNREYDAGGARTVWRWTPEVE